MPRPRYLLAIDQGSTSSRAIVFDQEGRRTGSGQHSLTQSYPQPGWVRHDPEEIWRTSQQAIADALADASVDVSAIAAIGITNQRETTIVWDRANGKPLAPAIVWQSRESLPYVHAINERGMSARYQQISGLPVDPYFSATKMAMLLDTVPELRKCAESGEALFGTVDSWLVWKLTGGRIHVTDASNASRTMLFDIEQQRWSEELLADLSIPAAMLPQVTSSSGFVATTNAAILGAELPICGIAGDQQASLFGQACFAPGEAKNTYGTGSFLLKQTGNEIVRSHEKLISTIAWSIGGETNYAQEGAIFDSGAAVQWLRDGLGIIASALDVEPLAMSVPDSGGVVFVPALSGLGAPHWDSNAAGLLIGITRGTNAGHIARATLEGIAFQVADLLDAMAEADGVPLLSLKVDGGAARNELLMQMQANAIGIPVIRPAELETTALGAAYLAGLGASIWQSQQQIADSWQMERRFEPQADSTLNREAWLEGVNRSLGWFRRAQVS